MLVKIAPDLSDSDIDAVARVLGDMQVDGVIATNTTVSRLSVQEHPQARETGGLSGAPLMGQATLVLRRMRTRLPDTIPLIGVGGILSGADAVAKMSAGASLVQCYTGLVYRGPELVRECVEAIRRRREAPAVVGSPRMTRGTASPRTRRCATSPPSGYRRRHRG